MSVGEQKNTNELSITKANGLTTAPAYLSKYTYDKSVINKAVRPPFIKYINYQSKPPYKPPFVDFDIIVTPHMIKIGDKENPFTFVPLIYFPTYNVINPYEMKGQLPFTREFTYDENSLIAKKCKTFCQTDPCPEDPRYMLQYRHTHNFFIIVENEPEFVETPVWMPLSGGEFKSGQNLVGLIQRKNAPQFCLRFRGHSANHSGPDGNWIGLNFLYDSELYVSEAQADVYAGISQQWDELIKDRMIDLSDDSAHGESIDAASESRF